MIQFLNFISSIAWLLYLACGLVVLFAIRSWWGSQVSRQHTIYSLEKEVASDRGTRALMIGFSAVTFGALVFMSNNNASVSAPAAAPSRSPTPNIALLFNTPTVTPTSPAPTLPPPSPTPLRGGNPPPVQPSPTNQPPQQKSPTPKPTATATETPAPAPSTPIPLPPSCPDLSARIISPGTDAHLSGSVPIIGTANIANFQYYKIEFGAGDQPSSWKVLGDVHRRPVTDNVLEVMNTASFAPGVYRLRLTVVDQSGNFPIAPCSVRVVIGT